MICDLVDYPLRLTPQKNSYTNTTASPKSSSDSSFEDKSKLTMLQIPRPLLSQDEKFEASLHAFEFRLLVPEQDSLCHLSQLSQELSKSVYQQLHPSTYFSLEIVEDNILHDERTTLMLKNVPKHMKPTDLRNVLNKEFRHQYDFLYLPADGTNEGNLGYAFVNFLTPEVVLQFYRKFNNHKWSNTDKQICQLKYAKLQGKRDLMNQIDE